jgi:hypothetical protein
VIGVVAGEGGAVARGFVGDPSAAGHRLRVIGEGYRKMCWFTPVGKVRRDADARALLSPLRG